jgi:hypothetical protein
MSTAIDIVFEKAQSASMVRLKNRNVQIPNGLTYYLPQTKWVPRQNSSFQGIAEALLYHLKGNPQVAKALQWPLEIGFISDKVDQYNAKLCETNGWTEYITEAAGGRPAGDPFSFPPPSHLARLSRVAAGGKTLVEWLASGAEAVPSELSEARAAVCATCPFNEPGNLSNFFTRATSEAIREALNQRREWKLQTSRDQDLGVCSACLCPLALKLHLPISRILKGLDAETKAALAPACWIKLESEK